MEKHVLRVAAEQFEEERTAESRQRFFAKLEIQGLVVSQETHKGAISDVQRQSNEVRRHSDEVRRQSDEVRRQSNEAWRQSDEAQRRNNRAISEMQQAMFRSALYFVLLPIYI